MPDTTPATYSYDEIPYPSHPFRQSHPDRLATVAKLFDLQPPPVERCRVLEIGCASGGNLIPLAEQLPGSQFLGIDLGEVQIEQGLQFIRRAGLSNVELRRLNVLDADERLGTFDYVLCHGVYSWVPDAVKDRILDVCGRHLSPQGVAFVSYNTYPGWHLRGMIRDMMCYHTRQFADPRTRIAQARSLLDFMAQHAARDTPFGQMLNGEASLLRNHADSYLYHEHLEENNSPIYFYQFAQRAAARGLQYLGEAEMSSMWAGHLPPEVATTLERLSSDLVQMEQYVDFIRNRTFRQTLLCRQGLPVDRELKPGGLGEFHVGSPLVPADPKAPLRSLHPLVLRHPATGHSLTTTDPITKAALVSLGRIWPATIPFPRLLWSAYSTLGRDPVVTAERLQQDTFQLGKSLLECYVSDMVELHTVPPCFVTQPSQKPTASRVARVEAEEGRTHFTNLRHEPGTLSELCRQLLPLLDGNRDRAALVEALVGKVRDRVLILPEEGASGGAEPDARKRLESTVDRALTYLGWNAFLVA